MHPPRPVPEVKSKTDSGNIVQVRGGDRFMVRGTAEVMGAVDVAAVILEVDSIQRHA